MNRLVWVVAFALLPATASISAIAAERPDWAFGPSTAPPTVAPPADPDKVVQVPGSTRTYTLKQLEDSANPPDWFPDEHPPMPAVVAHGNATGARACITCHVANGHGHPENSRLPGGTTAYLLRQLVDMRSGARAGKAPVNMINIAKGMSDEEMHAAIEYFGKLKVMSWTKVVETDSVPKTYFGRGNMRLPLAEGGTEPIGARIVELPQDPARVALRDPHSGFVAYAPKGSLEKGKALVTTGAGKTLPCGICHGPALKGLGDVPGIAGRSSLNIARQLYYFQTGERGGASAALMKAPVEKLGGDDILAIAAYVTSLEP
jgi:cytochrome c553